jgi:hypothetical protein
MRDWFKYEYGYVNLDSENLYLTNTGNWTETENLQEKVKTNAQKDQRRRSLMIAFVILVFCFFAFLLFKNFESGKMNYALIALVVLGGYKLYDYLRTDLGAKFMIPLKKIIEIKEIEKNIEIVFTNGEGNLDTHVLRDVDEKGISLLKALKK